MKGRYNGVTMKNTYAKPYDLLKKGKTFKRLSKRAKQRLVWIDWYNSHGKNARLTCRHFGISPSVFYRWKTRFNPRNLSSLESISTRPSRVRQPITDSEIVEKVVQLRKKYPAWSKYKIKEILKRDYSMIVSVSTVGRTLKRKGLINPKQYGYRRKSSRRQNHSIPRIKADKSLRDKHPGSLIQVDTKRVNVLGTTYYQFSAVDCYTRLQYVSVFSTLTSNSGKKFLEEVKNHFPFRLDIQSDNGGEFLKKFHQLCEEQKITHYFTYPRCPKQNGRVERLNQTSEYEYWDYQDDLIPELPHLRDKATEWNHIYNNIRPHQSLNYKTPSYFFNEWVKTNPKQYDRIRKT